MEKKKETKGQRNSFHVTVEGRDFKKVVIPVFQFKKWCKRGQE